MIQEEYIEAACSRLRQLQCTQQDAIRKAGARLAQAVQKDRLIYLFGAGGHTSLAVGELFFRVGGLANYYPITELGLTALGRAGTFIRLERCSGIGSALIESSGLGQGDVLVLIHTIGVNASCIDAALKAKELGAEVIGLASGHWQDEIPQDAALRHESKKNLRDIADIWIDDQNTVDDAVLHLEGMEQPAAPLSGIGTFAAVRMIELEAMEQCLEAGIVPPVWRNANTPQGEAENRELLKRYAPRVPML